MKSWSWIVPTGALLLTLSAITADAEHLQIAAKPHMDEQIAPVAPVSKCPKCQSDMEAGYVLDVRPIGTSGGGYDPEPADWVQGPVKTGWFAGLKVKARHRITANRCSNCSYVELYAK
jgi:predicted nucleic-acid-binding Zn-ribbon protein